MIIWAAGKILLLFFLFYIYKYEEKYMELMININIYA